MNLRLDHRLNKFIKPCRWLIWPLLRDVCWLFSSVFFPFPFLFVRKSKGRGGRNHRRGGVKLGFVMWHPRNAFTWIFPPSGNKQNLYTKTFAVKLCLLLMHSLCSLQCFLKIYASCVAQNYDLCFEIVRFSFFVCGQHLCLPSQTVNQLPFPLCLPHVS